MKLYQLKYGDVFTCNLDTLGGRMVFLGMDGMYAKVKHTDKEFHKKLCAEYAEGSPFFCLSAGLEVDIIDDPYLDEYERNE